VAIQNRRKAWFERLRLAWFVASQNCPTIKENLALHNKEMHI